MSKSNPPGWLRPAQAAKYLSISPRTLATWLRNGLIQYSKVGSVVLIERVALDSFLKRMKVESRTDEIVDQVTVR